MRDLFNPYIGKEARFSFNQTPPFKNGESRTKMRMCRTNKGKLVRDCLNPQRDQLYSLKKDPRQSNNLIDSDNAAAKSAKERLHKKIVEKMQKIDDPALKHVKE
jgi:hypothetical protein